MQRGAANALERSVEHPLAGVLPEPEHRNRRIRELLALLEGFGGARDLPGRLDALEALARWVAVRDRSVPLPAGAGEPPAETRRLAVAVAVLEAAPALRARTVAALQAVLAETQALTLLAGAGLPSDRGLAQETADRFFRSVLPSPRDEPDLAALLLRLFPSPRELRWLEGIPGDLFRRLAAALGAGPPDATFEPLRETIKEALCLLAARVQGLGLSEEIRTRSAGAPVRTSPFYRLPRSTETLVAEEAGAGAPAAERAWGAVVAGCRDEVRAVLAHLEDTGVSLDVVYALDVIEQTLVRMERLVAVLRAPGTSERAAAAHELLAVLVGAQRRERSLRALARSNLRLLARKIIDRAGRTGEHYITYGRRDYFRMLASAAGGGALTAGTAALKLLVSFKKLPLFVEGFLSGVNYAGSFILMQICGFTLATKQPSMTAATLAGAIGDGGRARLDELVTRVACICRSQMAAAIGNVGTVSVAALAFDLVWRWHAGAPFLPADRVDYVVGAFHPLESGTVPFAALTGVILWLSSLAAGWVENFAVYRRIPQGLAEHRLGRLVGQRTMAGIAAAFARNVSGFGGSIALGFMLGMCPVIGKFLGLPLDVRHVTLSTGTLALAASTGGLAVLQTPAFWWAVVGIGTIFVLNLSVSFMLALAVALRAKAVPMRDRLALARAIVLRMVRSPREFLLPPRVEGPPPPPHH